MYAIGIAIESAACADEALTAIERGRPDAVLASHPMPEVDGIELARRIKVEKPLRPYALPLGERRFFLYLFLPERVW